MLRASSSVDRRCGIYAMDLQISSLDEEMIIMNMDMAQA